MKDVPLPTVEKKGMYDDEEAEPLTGEQARDVIQLTRDHRSVVLYHFMNDTAFRISEAGQVTDADFDLSSDPPSVKVPNIAIKGVKYRGVRYLRVKTAKLVKTLMTGKGKHYTFRKKNTQQLTTFRHTELKKIRHVYDSLKLDSKYADTNRNKYNLHSWRKRCGTEYGKANTESLADGYLRHSKYLSMYHLKTKEDRIMAFKRAELNLAIDETEKLKIKNVELEKDKAEINELKRIQKITLARIDEMSEILYDKQTKQLEEGRDATDEELQEQVALIRLKMDIDPKFKEHFKKVMNEVTDVPEETKKKLNAI